MTTVKNKTEQVIDFLQQNPDFFIQHEKLLSKLNIPHQLEGNASSLIEYQVKKLQQENSLLKETVHLLEEADIDRGQLVRQIFDLSLSLFQSDNPETLYSVLNNKLRNFYAADHIQVMIFNEHNIENRIKAFNYINPGSKLRFMFTELFNRNKPLCDSLQAEYLELLFPGQSDQIQSTVILPLTHNHWRGLLILGSEIRNLYSHGFEIELLQYIGKLVTQIIDPWISTRTYLAK